MPARLLVSFALGLASALVAAPIDRHALVARHDVVLTNFDAANPLSVGNGEFCFTVDATGLQTFPEAFEKTTPLGTLSDWGWHTSPNPNGWDIDQFQFKPYTNLLRPRRSLCRRAAERADAGNQMAPRQSAPAASGADRFHLQARRRFAGDDERFERRPSKTGFVERRTQQPLPIRRQAGGCGNGLRSEIGFSCRACEIAIGAIGRLANQIHFPYGTGETVTADWSQPDAHETVFSQDKNNTGHFARKLDNDNYIGGCKMVGRREHHEHGEASV